MIINSIFTIFICTTLVTAILTIITINPVISVIFLITTFVQVAGLLLLWGINFVGISYIVIYVGAIAVLFLFVVMMIDVKLSESNLAYETSGIKKRIPLFVVITFMFTYIISMLLYPHNINPTTNNINPTIDYINSTAKKLYPTIDNLNNTTKNIKELPYFEFKTPTYKPTYSATEVRPIFFQSKGPTNTITVIGEEIRPGVLISPEPVKLSGISPNYSADAQYLPMDYNSLPNTSALGIDTTIHNVEQIEVLGQDLYTNSSILLITLSIILLLAMFATIIISKFKD